jgi:hypothetical protein
LGDRLAQIDNVNAVASVENETLHFGIPTPDCSVHTWGQKARGNADGLASMAP